MDDLIARLEKATGPDRNLADEVLFACGWRTNYDPEQIEDVRAGDRKCEAENGEEYTDTFAEFMNFACWYPPKNKPFRDPWIHGHARPDPLSSVDAALTVVPEGHSWEMDCWPTGRAKFHASVGGGAKMGMSNVNPAIALCIAALKARVAARYAAGEPQQTEMKA